MAPKSAFNLIYVTAVPLAFHETVDAAAIEARSELTQTYTPSPNKNVSVSLDIRPDCLELKNGNWWPDQPNPTLPIGNLLAAKQFGKDAKKFYVEFASEQTMQHRALVFSAKTTSECNKILTNLNKSVQRNSITNGTASVGQRERLNSGVEYKELLPADQQFRVISKGAFLIEDKELVTSESLSQNLADGGKWAKQPSKEVPDILTIHATVLTLDRVSWKLGSKTETQLPINFVQTIHRISNNPTDFAIEVAKYGGQPKTLFLFTAASLEDRNLILAKVKRRQIIRRSIVSTDSAMPSWTPVANQHSPVESKKSVFDFEELDERDDQSIVSQPMKNKNVEPDEISLRQTQKKSTSKHSVSKGSFLLQHVDVFGVDLSEKLTADKIGERLWQRMTTLDNESAVLEFDQSSISLRPRTWWPTNSCAVHLPLEDIKVVYALHDGHTTWAADVLNKKNFERNVYVVQTLKPEDRDRFLAELEARGIQCLQNSACGDEQPITQKVALFAETGVQTDVQEREQLPYLMGYVKQETSKRESETSPRSDTGYGSNNKPRTTETPQRMKRWATTSTIYKQRPPNIYQSVPPQVLAPTACPDRMCSGKPLRSHVSATSTKVTSIPAQSANQGFSILVDDSANRFTTIYFFTDPKLKTKQNNELDTQTNQGSVSRHPTSAQHYCTAYTEITSHAPIKHCSNRNTRRSLTSGSEALCLPTVRSQSDNGSDTLFSDPHARNDESWSADHEDLTERSRRV